ncbi:uncharacterized protein IUM83_01087 [Phytophthora cinnamomi]|uniref:uncharacterized protein n=1 Tax=Phytophthora cinnamomi TaxID=4785 RepID=UPI00355990DD|nr:hypothetical protein IUM83_01087 [Phytophthora cinnamomi]
MSETHLPDQYLYQSLLKSDPEIKVSSSKREPFVNDLNQGSYQNGVITIDATAQLNGSEGFASLRDAYIMLPYKVSMKNGATTQTTAANRVCTTLICGNWNVIDSLSLEFNGKTIVPMADYTLFWNNVRAQTGYSPQSGTYTGEFRMNNYLFVFGETKLIIDNDSGTYAPPKEDLPLLKALIENNVPGIVVEELDREHEDLQRTCTEILDSWT